MKPQELRIGNWVLYSDREGEPYTGQIMGFGDFGFIFCITKNNEWQQYEYYKPIPLTKKCLLKFGFKEVAVVDRVKFFDLNDEWEITMGEEIFFWVTDLSVKIEYVHQLQNLYFALTGKELEIKNLD